MSKQNRERLEALLADRRCVVFQTTSPVGYYIRTPEDSIITNRGYPLTYDQVERWLDERDACLMRDLDA